MALLLLLLLFTGTAQLFLHPASCSPPPSSSCDWCPRHTTASLLPPAAADLNDGDDACGYGADAMATELNGVGLFAAAAGADFFRDGAGCGACYQLRCRHRRVCGGDGVKVVVVTGAANRTGFLLSREAFAAMARRDHQRLAGAMDNNVQVDFRRIPCEYRSNLTVRVEEGSRNPSNLAIRFLYQGGQTDIAAVEIAQQAVTNNNHPAAHYQPSSWRPMARLRRNSSSKWRTPRAPAGPLRLRLVVTAGSGGKWLRAEEAVLPADWRPGQAYDTGLRVTDVAARSCRALAGGGGGGGNEEEEELR